MPCETKNCCFAPSGKVYIRKYDDCCWADEGGSNPHPWRLIGNASDFSVDANVTTNTQPDYMNCGGGTACSISKIDDIGVSFNLYCLGKDNMTIATAGELATVIAGNVINDQYVYRAGHCDTSIEYLKLDGSVAQNVEVSSVAVEIDGQGLQVDVDYRVTKHGIEIICDSPLIQALVMPNPVAPAQYTAGLPMTISFSHGEYSLIELFTGTSGTYEIKIEGENAAADCEPFTEVLYRVKIEPSAGVSLITGGDFAEWAVAGTVERDGCRDGYGTFALPN